jgi:hypothetical protein
MISDSHPVRHYLGRWRPKTSDRTAPLHTTDQLSPAEVEAIHHAENELLDANTNSAYFVLRDQRRALDLVLADVVREWSSQDAEYMALRRRVSTALENFLSSLRAFDDKTCASLSAKYGKQSKPYRVFKAALSLEYDNQAAYRIAYKLRNFMQHAGTVMRLEINEKLDDSGERSVTASAILPPQELLAWNGWGSTVKRDLSAMSGVIDAQILCDRVTDSCGRAYANAVLAQEVALKAAADLLVSYEARGPQPIDGRLTILTLPEQIDGLKGSSWTDVMVGLATGLDRFLAECRRAAEKYGPVEVE